MIDYMHLELVNDFFTCYQMTTKPCNTSNYFLCDLLSMNFIGICSLILAKNIRITEKLAFWVMHTSHPAVNLLALRCSPRTLTLYFTVRLQQQNLPSLKIPLPFLFFISQKLGRVPSEFLSPLLLPWIQILFIRYWDQICNSDSLIPSLPHQVIYSAFLISKTTTTLFH